jgi:tRNA uridine 5-carbamoylmethylation protein Kti12
LDKADKTVLKKFFDAYENKSQDKKFDKKTFTISTKDDKYTATEKK